MTVLVMCKRCSRAAGLRPVVARRAKELVYTGASVFSQRHEHRNQQYRQGLSLAARQIGRTCSLHLAMDASPRLAALPRCRLEFVPD